MWYKNQNKKVREKVKKFIKDGRFELAQGGWSSTNEASTSYEDIILNMHKGHEWLQKEFGFTPKVGWMLNQAGHSLTNA